MSEHTERLEGRRAHLEKLLGLKTTEYQSTKTERGRLFKEEWNEPDDAVWAELELLSTDITGYASQIVNKGFVSTPEEALTRLDACSVFDKRKILPWYLSEENAYPLLKRFAGTLDYIRLLVIEYITLQQGGQP